MTKHRRSSARLLPGLALLVLLPLPGNSQASGSWACTALSENLWRCVARDASQAGTGQPADATASMAWQDPAAAETTRATPFSADDLPAPAAGPPASAPTGYTSRRTASVQYAQPDRFALCPPVSTQRHDYQAMAEPGRIDLHAATAESTADNVYTLQGNAVVQHGTQRVAAERIVYRRDDDEFTASGGVQFTAPGLEVNAETARIQTGRISGILQQVSYALPDQHAHGSASSLTLEGNSQQHLENASYTTCPGVNPAWLLSAKKVDLDQAAGSGTARAAKIKFKGVPVAYVPYMSFPLDDRRKSGVLAPTVGQTDETGTDISLPYYWNIAPNYDATIVPRHMSDRGTMIGGEFRYLHENNSGEIRAEYLDSDKLYNDRKRSLVSVNHTGQPLARLETSIKASDVSDKQYFEDFGKTIVQTSQTSLERTAQANWHGDWWGLGVMVQNFQTIDPAVASIDRPYKQLPQVVVDAAPEKRLLGLKFSGHAELINFDHSDGNKVTGTRYDIQPRVSLPVHKAAWYVEPAISVRHTVYDLDRTATGGNNNPRRTTPVVSFDAGSFFERNIDWGEAELIQTLEPRLFYLYVPEKNQDDLPVFDTGNYDFNYWTLFEENRFTGPDRMGDANQAALALTSRILDPVNGKQLLSASLGTLVYFRDRKITLPGEPVARDNSSDLIGEVTMNLGKYWNANAEVQWNPHDSQTDRNDFRLQYRPGQRQLVNASYRRRRGIQEQADLSFLWPLSRSWHMVGRWYYSLDQNETIEAIAGLGYESCCWGAQLVGRNYINNDEGERNTAFFLQLELKGLGTLGNSLDQVLERGILGYQS
ncbi:MAG: LPS assembly protein LptD [Gammaproteobacteria bacterium]